MPVVKGGVWTNIEDEILKASVSKYGLNQWARVSSLLARKTPKQCKARWAEWLDPGIRKVEWSKEEDEKLLHLAKLMPTQWRTIAPIVGRTATQCLERYQKLLDEAEAQENDELRLGGPSGAETQAPSADDVRKLRPGELDPDPESKPARPDTIDLDEDEKEMLSEARARLANTQGKKAKRKARERQLEDSRRMALLQKRRELKTAGINIKINNRKPGQMDYNADIPFEKKAVPGFYDTVDEIEQNEKQREAYDPRKHQVANKRKNDAERDESDSKKRKGDNDKSSGFTAAAKAGQMQKVREAQQSSKRRPLNLPAPQVGEAELEDIVKIGMAGQQATTAAQEADSDMTKTFVNNYSGMIGNTPIRTPLAPPQQDHIANEIRNIRALTETQSSLLGGENTPLYDNANGTGFDGIAPRKHVVSTPNPLATPLRSGNLANASTSSQPSGPGATPLRTPRDSFALNRDVEYLPGATPRDLKAAEKSRKEQLLAQLASLPKPKEMEFELELPEEVDEAVTNDGELEEDAEERDRRERARAAANERAEFLRRTQVMQRNLPRPSKIMLDAMLAQATTMTDPIEAMIAREKALLIANDALKFPTKASILRGIQPPSLEPIDDELLALARLEIAKEVGSDRASLSQALAARQESENLAADEDQEQRSASLAQINSQLFADAKRGNNLEAKLTLHLGGYQKRAKLLLEKTGQAYKALMEERIKLQTFQNLQVAEEAAIDSRVEELMRLVEMAKKREQAGQEAFRQQKEQGGGV